MTAEIRQLEDGVAWKTEERHVQRGRDTQAEAFPKIFKTEKCYVGQISK